MNINKQYKDLVEKVYKEGFEYEDPNRKGVIRKQIPYYTLEHSFDNGFPAIGIKQTYPKLAFNEMKVFMQGKYNLKDLENMGVSFWRKDAYNYYVRHGGNLKFEHFLDQVLGTDKYGKNFGQTKNIGSLGKVYPYQIRNWNGEIDQLSRVLERLKENPMSTKNIITMWNPSDEKSQALTPCHTRFSLVVRPLDVYERQWFIENDESNYEFYYENVRQSEKESYFDGLNIPRYGLTVQWNQDSVDSFLGLPTNILYYSNLCYALAHYMNMKPLGILGNLTNVHLYDNSFSAVKEMLSRDTSELKPITFNSNSLPKEWTDLDDYLSRLEYVPLADYKHLGRLDVEMLAYSK